MVYTPFVQMEYVIKEYKLNWRPLEPQENTNSLKI